MFGSRGVHQTQIWVALRKRLGTAVLLQLP